MRKTAAALLALLAAGMLAGCAADEFSGNTQQSYTEAMSTADSTQPAETTAYTEPVTVEPTEESEEVQTLQADPVRLAEQMGSEALGLPDNGRVYIFRDMQETVTINGGQYYGVSCYDENEGQLTHIGDYYISPDGLTAYLFHPEDGSYRLQPEQAAFSGFDPESQSAEDIFAQANELYAAVFGELSFTTEDAAPLVSQLGNFYPVSDERLDTREKLNAALSRYFAGELLTQLEQGSDRVVNGEDGRLYCLEHYGTVEGYLGTEYTLAELTEERAVYSAKASFEYEAGNVTVKEFTCTAEKSRDGWRFVEFSSWNS